MIFLYRKSCCSISTAIFLALVGCSDKATVVNSSADPAVQKRSLLDEDLESFKKDVISQRKYLFYGYVTNTNQYFEDIAKKIEDSGRREKYLAAIKNLEISSSAFNSVSDPGSPGVEKKNTSSLCIIYRG